MGFRDHFSADSDGYARHRPRYPDDLFTWLAGQAPGHGIAVDVATGNGQAATALASRFDRVLALDASAAQVAAAVPAAHVTYAVAAAERLPLPDRAADLVTVAQALHWFDRDRFYEEARRVLVPGGVLAAWTYNLLTVSPDVDRVIRHLYRDVLGPWWPAERRLVESGYADIAFPFARLATPAFAMQTTWTCGQLLGYLRTWSAWQAATRAGEPDPLPVITPALRDAFGDRERPVHWPLALLVGRTVT